MRQVRGQRREGVPDAPVNFDGIDGPEHETVATLLRDSVIELDVRYSGSGAPFTGPPSLGP